MAHDLIHRYIWLVDTIRRYGRMTRKELDAVWMRSRFSNGEPLPRRTLYNYRQGAEELFNIEIKVDSATYEYYIESDPHEAEMTEWLLNATATNDLLANSRTIADKIFLEDIPSAREHLATVVDALTQSRPIRFDYHSYLRSTPTPGVVLEPYFVKLFRQRWYVVGRETASDRVKTYALDRISHATIQGEPFVVDPSFDAEEYFRYSFGIVDAHGEPRRIGIRTDPRRAKYLRALPLHHSQEEAVHDKFSIFFYKMRISEDLVEEILRHGPSMTVIEPPELRAMVKERLEATLQGYEA